MRTSNPRTYAEPAPNSKFTLLGDVTVAVALVKACENTAFTINTVLLVILATSRRSPFTTKVSPTETSDAKSVVTLAVAPLAWVSTETVFVAVICVLVILADRYPVIFEISATGS